jgi:ferredoxin-NADP reductase
MATANQPNAYRVKLQFRDEVADRTMAFYFEKPANFSFQPGQFVDLMLLNPPDTDSEGNTRSFTIASASTENHLMIATRLRDTAFKRVLMNLPFDTSLSLEGPFGKLTLPEDASRPLVFLAGGIGITPFRSMVVHATVQKLPHRIFLFYANRRPEDAPFLGQLQNLQEINPNFTFIRTMTKLPGSNLLWSGETGHINQEMLTKYVQGSPPPIYYVVGPPGMVKSIRTMLTSMGVENSDMKTEEFIGY